VHGRGYGIYKLAAFEMLAEAGVAVCVYTRLASAIRRGSPRWRLSRPGPGRQALMARAFVDAAGARFTEPNDYDSANSIGFANVGFEALHEYLKSKDARNARLFATCLSFPAQSRAAPRIVRCIPSRRQGANGK